MSDLVRLSPSVSPDLSRCSSHSGFAQMKSRQLYWLSGTLLGFEWEGRLQCARERFNLKSVQLAAEHSLLFKRMCVCVRKVCKGDTNMQHNLIKSNFDSASMSHPFKHISAGLPVMSTALLKLYSRLQKWTSLLLKDAQCIYTHWLHTEGPWRRRPGLWWNR